MLEPPADRSLFEDAWLPPLIEREGCVLAAGCWTSLDSCSGDLDGCVPALGCVAAGLDCEVLGLACDVLGFACAALGLAAGLGLDVPALPLLAPPPPPWLIRWASVITGNIINAATMQMMKIKRELIAFMLKIIFREQLLIPGN